MVGVLLGNAYAATREFKLAGGTVTLERQPDAVDVVFRSVRPSRVGDAWNVDVVVRNRSQSAVSAPAVLCFEQLSNVPRVLDATGVDSAGSPFLDLTGRLPAGGLKPGAELPAFTLSLARGSGAPGLVAAVYSPGSSVPILVTRTLDSEGLPLEGVTTSDATSGRAGWMSIQPPANTPWIQFQFPGRMPVFRRVPNGGGVVEIPSPRQTKRSDSRSDIGGAGAVVTSLTPQTLSAPLPSGWIAVAAAEIQFETEPSAPKNFVFSAAGTVASSTPLLLVRFDSSRGGWFKAGQVTADGGTNLSASIPSSGSFAVVAPDAGMALPTDGGELPSGTTGAAPPSSLSATGVVTPPSRAASRTAALVTAVAQVEFRSAAAPLPSGMNFRCAIREEYRMRDGSRRVPPVYETTITGYRRVSARDSGILHATFPLRPQLLLPGEELVEAVVRVDVLPIETFSGVVLPASGGTMEADGIRLVCSPDTFSQPQATRLRRRPATDFDAVTTGNQPVIAAFETDLATTTRGPGLSPQFPALAPNQEYVLARTVHTEGLYGLTPVGRFRSDATGIATSVEPLSEDRLPGVDGGGQYLLLQVNARSAVVQGVARDRNGQPAAGLAVRVGPWLAFSDATGRYRLLSPAGAGEVNLLDPRTGDTGFAQFTVSAGLPTTRIDVESAARGPRIVAVSPFDKATNVPRVSAVTLTFDKPLNPASVLGDGVRIVGPDGATIPASLSLNLARTVATLLPSTQLPAGKRMAVAVAESVVDTTGLPVIGTRQFEFTTEGDAIRRADAELVIHEPVNGLAPMSGGSGLAEPESPVILVNETTGFTSTVLSKPDGSFTNSIPADVDDELVVVLVNRNGTQTRIAPSRQVFADGSVGLFAAGGLVEAAGDGGTFSLGLEAGASAGRTVVRIAPVPLARATNQLPASPVYGGIAAALDVRISGDTATGSGRIAVPFDPAKFGVPANVSPTNMTFALAIAREVNGEVAYQIVDQMRFENGRVVASGTAPFAGWLNGLKEDPNPLFSPPSPTGRAALASVRQGEARPQSGIVFALFAAETFRLVVLAALDPPLLLVGKVGLCPLQVEGACLEEQFDPFFAGFNTIAAFAGGTALVTDVIQATVEQAASNSRLPLPGTIVDAARAGDRGPARFSAGLPYGVSDRGGAYRLLLPAMNAVYVARARHPSHQEPRFAPVAALFESSFIAPATKKNFTFVPDVGLNLPPAVTLTQSPIAPGVNQTATVRVDVVHALAPSATVIPVLESVRPLPGDTTQPPPSLSDVVRTAPVVTPGFGGPNQRRFTFSVQGTRPLVAVFKITTTVQPGSAPLVTTTRWAVEFGANPTPNNAAIQSDPLDKVGPSLVKIEPAQGGTLPLGEPIRLHFNEPIDAGIASNPSGFTLTPAVAGGFSTRLSADQTLLEIFTPTLASATAYTLQFQAPIKDLAGNPLQSGTASGLNLTLRFRTPATLSGSLPGIQNGGGAVVNGSHVFALDRTGTGKLLIFDASVPSTPLKIAEEALPGYPRDLEFIADWSYHVRPPQLPNAPPPSTHRNLLLIVGGDVGVRDPTLLNFDFQRQYLRVYDVTDPGNPVRVASSEISQRPAAVQKITWHPPEAAFFENGADFQQVAVLDLQAYILAYNMSRAERETFFFDTFRDGDDGSGRVNGVRDTTPNGHYVDIDDKLPLPERVPTDFFGRRFGILMRPSDGGRRLQDYAYDNRFGYGAIVFSGGPELDSEAQPTGRQLPPGYRTAFLKGDLLTPSATVPYGPNARPKRVHLEFQVDVSDGGTGDLRNLAFVSLAPDDDGQPKLHVIDVTDPVRPVAHPPIPLPSSLGLPQSVYRLPDGNLALAMTSDALVFDPTLALRPMPSTGSHPMFRNAIAGAGSGNQTLNLSRAGILAPNLGGHHEVVQLEPRLRIVRFRPNDVLSTNPVTAALAGTNVLLAADLKDNAVRLAGLYRALQQVAHVQPASLNGLSSNTPSLLPPTRPGHYYALLEAPGGAGASIQLGLQSLNRAGLPLRNKGRDYAAVRAVTASAAASVEQSERVGCDAPIREFRAYRLSDDPKNEFYNLYLSDPFAVVAERAPLADLEAVQLALPRAVLWSAFGISAFIDPTMATNDVLGPFAARPSGRAGSTDDLAIQPRTEARAETFPGTYIPGPNPPPVNHQESIPGTFGMINAGNGEMRHSTADMEIPGRAMGIVFARNFGGQDLIEGPFGRGWDFSYNQQVIPLRPQTFGSRSELMFVVAALTNASGSVAPFARSGDAVFSDGMGHVIPYINAGATPPAEVAGDPLVAQLGWTAQTRAYYLPSTNFPGIFDPLFEFKDGSFARLTPDGMQYWYDRLGRLTKVYHAYSDNFQELQYNERSELTRIIDRTIPGGGRYLEIGYYRRQNDALFLGGLDERTGNNFIAGRIARLRDFAGRVVEFRYDNDGILQRRLGIAGDGANGGSGSPPETVYLWDGGCSGTLGGISVGGTTAQPATTLFTAQMDTSTQTVQGGGTGAGGTVGLSGLGTENPGVTGPDGAVTTFNFDQRGYPATRTESGAFNGTALTRYAFDHLGLMTNQTLPLGDTISFVYDSKNANLRSRANLLSIQRTPGTRGGAPAVTSIAGYDPRYNLPAGDLIDENGKRHTYNLTGDGRSVSSIVHENAGQTTHTFNSYGQLERTTTPEGLVLAFEISDSSGYPTARLRGSHRFTLSYDNSRAAQLGMPTGIIPPRGASITIRYDDRLLATHITRGNFEMKLGYDANENLIYSEQTAGATDRLVERRRYNQVNFLEETRVEGVDVGGLASTLVTQFHSTPQDAWRLRSVVHPGGQVRTYDYDHLGALRRMTLGPYVEDYDRDLHGNVIAIRKGGQLVQTIAYDGHDRPTNIVKLAAGGTETERRGYFPGGQLAEERHSDSRFGDVSHLLIESIDALGRPKRQRIRGSSADGFTEFDYPADATGGRVIARGPRDTVEVRHNTAGNLVGSRDSRADTTFTPDANGNITSSSSLEGGRTFTTQSGFDPLDFLTDESDPIGLRAQFDRRPDGAAQNTYDGLQNRTRLDLSVLGEILQRTKPNGVQFNLQYNTNRQVTLSADVALKGELTEFATDTFRATARRTRSGNSYLFGSINHLNLPEQVQIPGGQMLVSYDPQGRETGLDASYAPGEPYKVTYRHDGLGRVRESSYGRSGQHSATFDYDLLGPMTRATYVEALGTFTVSSTHNADTTRATLTYPGGGHTVVEGRDAGGRLTSITDPVGRLIEVPTGGYAGQNEVETMELGGGLIRQTTRFDERRRPAARTYQRIADRQILADVRYRFDAADNVLARQEVHRHGRTDRYEFDGGNRLTRVDVGLRPAVPDAVRHSSGGLKSDFGLEPGLYARTFAYDGQGFDLLTGSTTLNPNPLTVAPIPFAQSLATPDGMLFPTELDGVARPSTDPLGVAAATRLLITQPGGFTQRIPATFKASAFGQLVRVERADGVVVEYEHQPNGLIHHRRVTTSTSTNETSLVWDAGRLLAEFERVGGTNRLRARYFYADEDSPFAADLADGGGVLKRFWYLRDVLNSVVAVADPQGEVIERVQYDAWGQPVIEGRDTRPPQVAVVAASVNGQFLVQFSERVFPELNASPAPGIPGREGALATTAAAIPANAIQLVTAGGLKPASLVYEEDLPVGFPFGALFRVVPESTSSGEPVLGLQVSAGFVVDEWGNPNVAETVNLSPASGSQPLYQAPAGRQDTSAPKLGRSGIGSPMLFHGQYFDADTGLVYLRARFYDPSTGLFLQPDPNSYGDSPNPYLGFAGNPVSGTDNTGLTEVRIGAGSKNVKPAGAAAAAAKATHPPRANAKPSGHVDGLSHAQVRERIADARADAILSGQDLAEVRVKLGKRSTELVVAEEIEGIMSANPRLRYLGHGGGGAVFGIEGTQVAFKTYLRSTIMHWDDAVARFPRDVNGFRAFHALGYQQFFGSSKNGRFQIELLGRFDFNGRPTVAMEWLKGLRDMDSPHGRPANLPNAATLENEAAARAMNFAGSRLKLRGEINAGFVPDGNGGWRVQLFDPPPASDDVLHGIERQTTIWRQQRIRWYGQRW